MLAERPQVREPCLFRSSAASVRSQRCISIPSADIRDPEDMAHYEAERFGRRGCALKLYPNHTCPILTTRCAGSSRIRASIPAGRLPALGK